jgi:hypothetical protein
MKSYKSLMAISLCLAFLFAACCGGVFCQEHLQKLDDVRLSMGKVGGTLPDLIRKAKPGDIRTLERLFEINNYALVTIESYLKMIRIALASSSGINKDVLGVLNGWLKFVAHYCDYDIKYIEEALTETKDTAVIEVLKAEKQNISNLRDTTQVGIKENTDLSSKI